MMNKQTDKMNEMNTKAFGLYGAIQGAKEAIGLYADGSNTLEATFAKGLWYLLDNHQQILIRARSMAGSNASRLRGRHRRNARRRDGG